MLFGKKFLVCSVRSPWAVESNFYAFVVFTYFRNDFDADLQLSLKNHTKVRKTFRLNNGISDILKTFLFIITINSCQLVNDKRKTSSNSAREKNTSDTFLYFLLWAKYAVDISWYLAVCKGQIPYLKSVLQLFCHVITYCSPSADQTTSDILLHAMSSTVLE